jgi:hypothetical protein
VAHDDWRLRVVLDEEEGGARLLRALPEMRLEKDVRERLGRRLSVSREGGTVFVYADAEAAVREAERVVRDELARHGASGAIRLDRWHPVERRWEDAGVPLPRTPAELEAEHTRQQADEAAESAQTGQPRWEVRLELAEHPDAVALADRLAGEGVAVERHWRYLLVGAANREEAEALAERLRAEAPDARVEVEPSGSLAWEVQPPNPFAIFGGLGV